MGFTIGSYWRVCVPNAYLEAMRGQSYGGAVAWSFQKHRLSPGDVIRYRGSRNVGSDSFPEDVFELVGKDVHGAFSPNSMGAANKRAIAPVVGATLKRGQRTNNVDIGSLLDRVDVTDLLAFTSITAETFLQLTAQIELARMLVARGRKSLKPIAVRINESEFVVYQDYRKDREDRDARMCARLTKCLEAVGGSKLLRPYCIFEHEHAQFFRWDFEIAVARGAITHIGDTIALPGA